MKTKEEISPTCLYRISQVAKLTGTPHAYVRRLIKSGDISAQQIGKADGQYRILGSALIAFLDRMEGVAHE